MQARRHQRRTDQRAHLQFELRLVAGVQAVVAGVVRPRRHLVGDQPAVAQHEKLDAQHADVVHRRGQPTRCAHGLGLHGIANPERRHRGHRQDAAAVQVVLHRQVDRVARAIARHDHADFVRQRQQRFKHAAHAAERAPAIAQFGHRRDAKLALAVVAEAGRLQHAGQQMRRNSLDLFGGFEQCVRCARHPAAREVGLLGSPVLANRHTPRRGRHAACPLQPLERCGRHVLEFGGHGGTATGQLRQCRLVEVAGLQVPVGHATGRAGFIGIEHRGEIAEPLRRVHEHAPELAAAQHPERRTRRDERRSPRRHRRAHRRIHFRSAVIARAAAVWRAR